MTTFKSFLPTAERSRWLKVKIAMQAIGRDGRHRRFYIICDALSGKRNARLHKRCDDKFLIKAKAGGVLQQSVSSLRALQARVARRIAFIVNNALDR